MTKLLLPLLLAASAHAESPERTATRATAQKILKGLTRYYQDCGAYPTTEQGLDALFEKPDRGACAKWGPSPYLAPLTQDAWGHYWNYSASGKTVELTSFGKDGKEGGAGENEDLVFRISQ